MNTDLSGEQLPPQTGQAGLGIQKVILLNTTNDSKCIFLNFRRSYLLITATKKIYQVK